MQFFNYTFLPIGNFTKSFCGFTSRKAVFAREEALKLRILTVQDGTATQLLSFTKVMTNDFPLSRSLLSGHAKVTKIANLRRNAARF